MTQIRSVEDLSLRQVDWVLDRAEQQRSHLGGQSLDWRSIADGAVVGLAFLEPSLRTRIGFSAAAARLGATPVEVNSLRSSWESKPESIEDTLRTLGGYCDVVVARVPQPFTAPAGISVPMLNGGDRGPFAEHPSQALIDIFAFGLLPVAVSNQTIALCGDLRMRAARSLLRLLALRRPRQILLVTEPELLDGFALPVGLDEIVEYRSLSDVSEADALYIVGLPYGVLDEDCRTRLRVTKEIVNSLATHAGVFSPLPVIDEIEREAIADPRVRMFSQSDDGLFVRMAVLEFLLGDGPH